jgi:NADPH:quinone reductase-like Zn-dependent oxidoreductase
MASENQPLTMRAVRVHAYGGPEIMRVEAAPVPEAGPGERLVRLHAASVNPVDWKMRQGFMKAYFPLQFPRILGRDGAGLDNATGERVMGLGTPNREGTHAEYAVFSHAACAVLPEDIALEDAAALGVAGLSAWIALVENAQVAAGQKVLVHAGAGGVGSLAMQIAHLRGADVWTTCSSGNAQFCRDLGAARVVDYTREDFSRLGQVFDVVLDTLGGAAHRLSAEVLKPGGALVFLNTGPVESVTRKDVRVMPTEVRATPERLSALLSLVQSGKLKVPIEARFPLERAAEAYEVSRGGHARGKIVLTMT